MDWPLFMNGMTETWRKGRKILDGSLRPDVMMSYREVIQEKTHELLAQLRTNPRDFRAHVRLLVGCTCYIARLLTPRQPSGKNYYVTHVWLRPGGW